MKMLLLALAVTLGAGLAHADENDVTSTTDDQAQTQETFESMLARRRIVRGEGCTPEGAYIQWACGGRPAGRGWVRVDRNCWHRDTGRRCY